MVFWDKNRRSAPPRAARTAAPRVVRKSRFPIQIHDLTGLYKTPYYSVENSLGTRKLPGAKAAADAKRLLIAPVATYIIWRLSGGKSFVIDPSQAQRTLLLNLRRLKWEPKLLSAFGVAAEFMPEIKPSVGRLGQLEAAGRRIPVTAMLGDQQAAMLGLGLETPDSAALNYGTGAFLLVNTGRKPLKIRGLLNSIGWQEGGQQKYLLLHREHRELAGPPWSGSGRNSMFDDIGDVDGMCRKSKNRIHCLPAIGGLARPTDFTTFTTLPASPHTDKYDVVRGVTEDSYMVGDAFDLVRKKDKDSGAESFGGSRK